MADIDLTTTDDDLAIVTITRPERLNALSSNTLAAMHRAFDSIGADPAIRAVVVTGEGTAFCAGADMKADPEVDANDTGGTPLGEMMPQLRGQVARTFASQEFMAGLFEKIHRLRQPVIAAVNGHAHGGGFALSLACDIRFAARSATFGAVFIKRGVSSCDMGTSYHLPRLVGASRSAELLLTGRVFDATEAERMGLVVEVVDDGTVLDRALVTARQIAEHGPLAVWMTKETMWQTVDSPSLRHALDLENRTQIMCTATGELTEAFQAFRDRRTPTWNPL